MSIKRPQRPSADATRKKILQVALQLFMKDGFAGTSMGKLAAKANINQTLIFHHFVNKRQLWLKVKETIIDGVQGTPIDQTPKSLQQFLSEAIEQRMAIYNKCPKLKKLIAWQKLENLHKNQELLGTPNSLISPLKWLGPIVSLQNEQLLNPKLKPELVLIWLLASIDGMINDDLGLFKNNHKNQKNYIEMLITSLAKGLV